jgi:hypothetical protein
MARGCVDGWGNREKTIDPRWCPGVEYGFELTLSNKRLTAVGMGLQKAQSVSRSPERKWHIVYNKAAIVERAM